MCGNVCHSECTCSKITGISLVTSENFLQRGSSLLWYTDPSRINHSFGQIHSTSSYTCLLFEFFPFIDVTKSFTFEIFDNVTENLLERDFYYILIVFLFELYFSYIIC